MGYETKKVVVSNSRTFNIQLQLSQANALQEVVVVGYGTSTRANLTTSVGSVEGNTQAGYALVLSFGLLPDALKEKAADHMVAGLKKYDGRVSTGIHSTVRLMNELTEHGHTDIAYKLLETNRFPSWLYSVREGATTVWERWDGYVKGRIHLHRALASLLYTLSREALYAGQMVAINLLTGK